jgi:predicted N-acetyltransferase YhbS
MNTLGSAFTSPRLVSTGSKAFSIRAELAGDAVAREALLDLCFGVDRLARTCQRLRDGRLPARGLAFSAVRNGQIVGTVRLWHVSAGRRPSLILGPLAVDPSLRELGIGGALMRHAIAAATARGYDSILLLGDAPYYERFGFSAAKAADLQLPGSFARERLLGLELRDGALDGAFGMIMPTGETVRDRLKAEPARRLTSQAA